MSKHGFTLSAKAKFPWTKAKNAKQIMHNILQCVCVYVSDWPGPKLLKRKVNEDRKWGDEGEKLLVKNIKGQEQEGGK